MIVWDGFDLIGAAIGVGALLLALIYFAGALLFTWLKGKAEERKERKQRHK